MTAHRGLVGAVALAALLAARSARADAPPRLISAPEVSAPEGVELPPNASVALRVTIDVDGHVTEVEVVEGVRADIDAQVMAAAREMVFAPAERGGQHVPARVRFRFRLRPTESSSSSVSAAPAASAEPSVAPTLQPAHASPTPTARPSSPSRRERASPDDGGAEQRGITVRGRHEPGAATRMSFRAEELTTVPGTFGEPTRIVASQPGVARTPFGLGYFIVRGASFENTGFFIDGFPVLILYHLAAGPAVISSRLVGQLDFYPGGYPLQYGRFAAGVISLETRPPPTDRPRAEIEVDFFRASALGVVPFDHGRGTVAVALRRSYYDFLLPLISPGIVVNYTDGQIRADYRFTSRLRGSVFFFASGDTFDRTQADGVGATAATSRDALSYAFHRTIARLDWRGPQGVTAQASAMVGYDDSNIIQADPGRPDRGFRMSGTVIGQRASIRLPINRWFTTTIGVDNLAYVYNMQLAFPSPSGLVTVPPPQSNPRVANLSGSIVQFGLAGYVEEVVRAGRLEFTAGPRFEMVRYFDQAHLLTDPRAVARLRLFDGVTAIASTGLFHQAPPFFALMPQAGNPNLLPQRAWQSSFGVEATLPWNIEARITGFYNRMWQLVRPTYTVIMTPDGPQRAFAVSDGHGQSYGMEILLRRRLERGVYGWLSYTLSRSERWLEDPITGQIVGRVVPFSFDQTHVLNLALSWNVNQRWRVGGRFQLATGSPTSLVQGATYDADADGFRPRYVSEADRLPLFHQLDVRVDYKFRFGPAECSAYIDVLNVYNAQTSENWVYQYDYADRRPRPGIPILPTLGFRGEL